MKEEYYQTTLFDDIFTIDKQFQYIDKEIVVSLSDIIISKLKNYSLEKYIKDIETDGLENTWAYICEYVLS